MAIALFLQLLLSSNLSFSFPILLVFEQDAKRTRQGELLNWGPYQCHRWETTSMHIGLARGCHPIPASDSRSSWRDTGLKIRALQQVQETSGGPGDQKFLYSHIGHCGYSHYWRRRKFAIYGDEDEDSEVKEEEEEEEGTQAILLLLLLYLLVLVSWLKKTKRLF